MNIRILSIAALAVGAVLIIIGIVFATAIPLAISKQIRKDVHLGFDENGTYNEMTRRWIKPNYSMILKVFVVSVKNPNDVIENGSYPEFVEKGPYAYREYQEKVKVDFLNNNTYVLYRNRRKYIYDQEQSCSNCSLNDLVTIPNILFQEIVDIAAKTAPFTRKMIEILLKFLRNKPTPFITVTVGEMLFKGYRDPVIEQFCNYDIVTKEVCIVANIPRRINFLENNTDDGEYLINTGLSDVKKIGRVYEWNGRNETPWWNTVQARMINGTDGELFAPSLSTSNDLPIFIGQLGRSIYLRYEQMTTSHGIPTYRYIIPSAVYDPFLPENKGFCHPETPRYFSPEIQPEGCLPAGIFDIGYTKTGSPRIYTSGVRFYNSPVEVYQNFTGFPHPDNSYGAYIDLEPYTGVVVSAVEASQINIGMTDDSLHVFEKIPHMIVPVLWFNEFIALDDETKKDLERIVSPSRAVHIVGFLLVGLGVLFWIIFLAISLGQIYLRRNADDEEHLIEDDGEN